MAADRKDIDPGSGVLLLRAWLHEGKVIARIQSFVAGDQEQSTQVALGVEQIVETVRRWLDDLAETRR